MERNIAMELLSICVQMGWYGGRTMPVLLEAVPGCAKTQAVHLLGKKLAAYLAQSKISTTFATETFVLPQTMPESIEGIPSPDMESNALTRLPLIGIRRLIEAQYGIWFGDEVTSAPVQTGAATMTLIQDGVAGDVRLPDTIGRVMACNPPDCAAAGREFSPPEINRVLRLEWDLPNSDFLSYLRGGEGLGTHVRFLSEDWESRGRPRAMALVASYLERNPSSINTMRSGQTTVVNASKPWASQRQWENVLRILAAIISLGEDVASDMSYMALKGLVSEGVADSFMGWLREMDLPDPEEILQAALVAVKDKKDFDHQKWIPKTVWERPDKLRICLESVAMCAQQELEDRAERWTAAFKVVEPVLDKKPDNATGAAKILCDRKPAGVQVPDAALKLFAARHKAGLSGSGRK